MLDITPDRVVLVPPDSGSYVLYPDNVNSSVQLLAC